MNVNKDLMVFEDNGNYLVDSRNVATMVDKEHSKLLRDIRIYCAYLTQANFGLSEYFVEHSYLDSTGRELPCYLCTKKGCDVIAHKLTGKKGVIFTATYVTAFEKMKKVIEDGKKLQNTLFSDLVRSVDVVADSLNVNEASKILMYEKLYKSCGQPTEFLPKYEINRSREMDCATSLLKELYLDATILEFNEKMREQGFLERRSRRSTKNGNLKHYNSLTPDGLRYGENAINPHNQRETQPLYYKDTFKTLFFEIFGYDR